MQADGFLFEMRQVTKEFPGVKALDNVTFQVKPGTVHALCGENGAGKSTLMKVLAGIYQPDGGEVVIQGRTVHIQDAKDAMNKGISMIHQELNLFPQMTVEANLYIGRENSRFGGVVNRRQNLAEVNLILKEYEIDIDPNIRMAQLTIAKQQMIEIVRAIAFNAQIIIMDEPTSSLTENETKTLFKMIHKLVEQGKAVIYISHKLDEIFEIADMVTVIRDGRTIGTLPIEELDKKKIVKMMVGRDLKDVYGKEKCRIGKEKLRVSGLSQGKAFRDIDFQLYEGEILGFLGLVGAGRSEVAETIFGLRRADQGQVYISGKKVSIRHPWNAIANKMAFITEDRKIYGLSLIHSVRQNVVISSMGRYASKALAVVSQAKEKKAANDMIEALRIKTPDQATRVETLSGGNQQKVVIGKWLLTEPDILIMDEPTRGIDIGAKSEIYRIMNDMASRGKSILMISSEMPELLGMCDRILVMCAGKQMGIFTSEEFNQFKLMACAAGETKEEAEAYEN